MLPVLLAILFGTFVAMTILNMLIPTLSLSLALRGRMSLAFLFIFTGIGHFLMPEGMAQMLPDFVPMRVPIIFVSGILEILGGLGLLIPKLSRLTSVALILFLIGVLPSNIYAAFAHIDFGGHGAGPAYLLIRVPFQFLLIAWAYYFGIRTQSES